MSESQPDPALGALASALRDLMPAGAIDRDRVLYDAGRRSVRSRAWPLATGMFAALSAALGVRLATLPEPTPRVEYVRVPVPAAVEPTPAERSAPVERVVRRIGLIDRLFPGMPLVTGSVFVRHSEDWPRESSADAGPVQPPSPPVERWLGLPSILFSDPLKPHAKSGLYRGEV